MCRGDGVELVEVEVVVKAEVLEDWSGLECVVAEPMKENNIKLFP